MSAAADHAYAIVRTKILEGELKSGDRLKEGELSSLCEVSRTPVREALRRLEADGLVRITPNSGAIVAEWDLADIDDIYLVRMQLEALAARLAAVRRTELHLKELSRLATEMSAAIQNPERQETDTEITRLNNEFHHLIIEAARSKALCSAASQVVEAPLMLRTFQKYDVQRLQRSVSDHIELVEAIREKDADAAESIMKAHILCGLRSLQRSRQV